MKPEIVLRAYRKTLIPVRLGIQGPIRARRARQRDRFLMYLFEWADRGRPPLVVEIERRR